jgi:hypothetical protein
MQRNRSRPDAAVMRIGDHRAQLSLGLGAIDPAAWGGVVVNQ